jgi:hypothetical protein
MQNASILTRLIIKHENTTFISAGQSFLQNCKEEKQGKTVLGYT